MANDSKAGFLLPACPLMPGQIGWIDRTVPDADGVRDFYREGDTQDCCMNAANGQSVAGICHALGDNAGLEPVWTIYIVVADLDAALEPCQAPRGGKLLGTPKTAGDGSRFCPIQDPAGAIAALYESRLQAE